MNRAAVYHRPESEFAFLTKKDSICIRIRTAKEDVESITLQYGDPYDWTKEGWQSSEIEMKKALATDIHQYWTIYLTPPFNRLNYGFILNGIDGDKVFYGDQGFEEILEMDESDANGLMGSSNYFKMPYFQELDRFKAIDWVKDTVWYQIFSERFENGDPANDNEGVLPWNADDHPERDSFYGGDIRGIINRLDHLESLGVNGIYFCPLFESPTNHKYDTLDYKSIDPHFGTKEDFKELVEKCHKRGIKIMLDAVFNHIGDESPQWKDVVENGENSKYAKWFYIHEFPVSSTPIDEFRDKCTYETFAFTRHMPKLNTSNPEVVDYLLDIATYWIREFDIDAWRLDVANEVDHAFWKKFKTACDEAKEDFYIIGEIWTSAQSWLYGDEYSGVMNYAFTGAIVDFFAKKKITLSKMVQNMNAQLMLNRDQTNQMMFNLLDSHDAPRILSVAKDDKDVVKQMFALMFMQNGTPDIYYGTEVGMNGKDDPDNRKPMEWREEKQDKAMLKFFKDLIAFRKTNSRLLAEGELEWKIVDETTGLLRFIRTQGGKTIVATFNTGEKDIAVEQANIQLSNLATIEGNNVTLQPKGYIISKG